VSRSTLIGRALDSLDDAKIVATQLKNALEEVGVAVPRVKLLEVVARLCGAYHYDELQYRLKGRSHSDADGNEPSAEVRLLTLPEVLLLKKPECDGSFAEHLEFFDRESATHWCYAIGSAAIKPSALEAARRLVRGEPLRPTDTKWLTGSSSKISVIDDERVDGALNIDTQALAGAVYLGEGKWSVGPNYYCRVSANDPLLIERFGVPLSSKAMADEVTVARCFSPPLDLVAAGFEAFTVNIEARLMLRCLTLPNPASVLGSLRLVEHRCQHDSSAPGAASYRLRMALMRVEKSGAVRVIRVTGRKEHLLAGLSWEGTKSNGVLDPTAGEVAGERGSNRSELDYSGADGLTRIWHEIREWAANTPLSETRREELQKWVAGRGKWEQQSDQTGVMTSELAGGS
jgi:hypothetical protein